MHIGCLSLDDKGYMFVGKQQTPAAKRHLKRIQFYNFNVSIL